jgi:hypothetical protein
MPRRNHTVGKYRRRRPVLTRKRGGASIFSSIGKSLSSSFGFSPTKTITRYIPPIVTPPRSTSQIVTSALSGLRTAGAGTVGSSALTGTLVAGIAAGKSPQQIAIDALFSKLSATGLPTKIDEINEKFEALKEIQEKVTEFSDNWEEIQDY